VDRAGEGTGTADEKAEPEMPAIAAARQPGPTEARMFEQALEVARDAALLAGASDGQVEGLVLRLRRHVGPALFTLPAPERAVALRQAAPQPATPASSEVFRVLDGIARESAGAFDL
jgi:hypothetical protein